MQWSMEQEERLTVSILKQDQRCVVLFAKSWNMNIVSEGFQDDLP